ncbi:hypothetical protein PR048_002239 [Dryococelus australis]|uniref:Cadherin domain-containing protein n=1 Tax=Dryococelus australis TaxID=614101 RepID=A0ABQ9IJM1_9NEOP|nr:hypothetical protein PR048_002239 [Dryococelus australis]
MWWRHVPLMRRVALLVLAVLLTCGLVSGQGPGARKQSPASRHVDGPPEQMQSRAVDTRVQLEVAEGQPRGTLVGRIPTKPGFTYRFNEPPAEFELDPVSGEVRTAAVLDRESLAHGRYDLVVLSSQPTYPIEVRIAVLDVNDNSPEFPEPSIAVSFSESAAPGTRVLLDAATDSDAGRNGVSDDYRIVGGNSEGRFRLVVTSNPSGDITYLHLETTGKLDREARAHYDLNVSARDGGEPPRFVYLRVNVTVLDVNDNPPIFDHSDYSVSLNESVPPGTPFLQVTATDSDSGDNARVTYYLADTEHRFVVDPETGVISTAETLDCPQQSCPQPTPKRCPKSCVFTVYARDHGSPRQDGRTYVTVNLVDANDHDPVIRFRYFPSTAGYATVDENAANGSVVAAVSIVDLDEGPNGETTVEIRSGNELGHFRLERTPSFDIVRVAGVLDRERVGKYNLTVVATDKGTPPRTSTAFLVIRVNDVNDHEPVFEKSEYQAVLSELAPPGTFVAGISASDEDSGVNARVYYAIVSGNERGWFDMDADTGLVTTWAPLDRELQDSAELRISARDGGPNPKWAHTTLKVTVLDENDERPEFSQERINVTLSESAPPDTLVAMLTAADHDQGTNGSVTYNLLEPGVFALDPLTGQLTTRTKLDREATPRYEVRVIAKDQGVPPQSSTATVFLRVLDVNDNSPEFYPRLYFSPVPEDAPTGTSVLTVTATDLDEGENAAVTYSLESGDESLFVVDRSTGVVSLKRSLRDSPKPYFRLRISATDRGGRRAPEDAEVEVIKDTRVDDLEFDTPEGYEFEISEDPDGNEPHIGREVGRVSAGLGEAIRYYIVLGDPRRSFQVDERSGVITTANRIDREQVVTYTLTVVARAGHAMGRVVVSVVVLDENDCQPQFTRARDEVKVPENAAIGSEVYFSRARDRDSGPNSRVTYSLSMNPDSQFRVSQTTGVIYLNKPIMAAPGTTMQVEVLATDGGDVPLSSKHMVTALIEDVNDHTPVFDHTSYETSLLESAPVNDRFFALSASDSDLADNGRVSYQITEGNAEGKFGIFPDGFLYVRNVLDREERDYYSLSVTAKDSGNPARSSIVPLVVHVIDENDNSPQFTNTTFSFHVMENEPPDSFVGKLTATDADIGRNAELTFSLPAAQRDFAIDPKNGFIKTLHVFDREELVRAMGQGHITLEAIVSDNGALRLRDKVKVNVYVSDENDNAPKFLRTPYRVQISEVSPVGAQVFRVFTSDADDGLNGDVFYSLTEGNEGSVFAVDEATGQLTVVRPLDRESVSQYKLTVMAQDAGLTVRLNSTEHIEVDVLDENDNAPQFSQTEAEVFVMETAPTNTRLLQFKATDADLGVNSEVTFSITAGNRRDTFLIDPASGALYLRRPLDYEDVNSYALNITASDGGSPRLSSTIVFKVFVEDFNDNPPAFPSTAIVRQIREGISVHTPIVTVTAEDPDSGPNGRVMYTISRQEPADEMHFGIDASTGIIHTLLAIDRERVDTFRLTVVATDQAEPPSARLSAEKLVTVIVEDVNDNAPLFVSMSAAVFPRDTSLLVMRVVARDLDSGTNGLVTYELAGGDDDNLFSLHRGTGALTLRRRTLEPPAARFHLAVKATDEAVQSERKSTDGYITVVAAWPGPGGPQFEAGPASGSVAENEPPGTSVARVSARARHGDVEYHVVNVTAAGGRQAERLFDVDPRIGVVSTAESLDREAGSDFYDVEVMAVELGPTRPKAASLKVSAARLSPTLLFACTSYLALVHDLASVTVRLSDADSNHSLTYSRTVASSAARFTRHPCYVNYNYRINVIHTSVN